MSLSFFSRRERRKRQQKELAENLSRIRDAANAGAKELEICGALLALLDEQLEAAVAVNDEASAREIMAEMTPLIAEHKRLVERERLREQQLGNFLSRTRTEENKNG